MIKIKMRSSFPSVSMKLQEKNIVPTIAEQIVVADEDFTGLSKVVVQGVTSNIDENIQAENIRKDTTILGVVGTLESIKEEQAKTITPNFSNGDITVLPDENMVISEVIIKTDEDLLANNIREGVEIFGVTGNVVELKAEERVVAPTIEEQVILPGENKNALSKVTIGAVTSAIDENITPDNIKNGVEILGVIGTVSGAEKITNGSHMFYSNARINQLDYLLSLLNGTITNANAMFQNCNQLRNLDLSDFDTSQVTNMTSIFASCSALETLNLNGFKTNNVTKMNDMFGYCGRLTELDLSSFNTINVNDMTQMFNGCSGLTEINLSSFDTRNVTKFYYLFNSCSSLTELNLNHFDISKLINCYGMFYSCSALERIVLSSWIPVQNINATSMFFNCRALQYLDMRNFDFSKITTYNKMFDGVPADCEIIVKDDDARDWVLARKNDFTNIKTVAEL